MYSDVIPGYPRWASRSRRGRRRARLGTATAHGTRGRGQKSAFRTRLSQARAARAIQRPAVTRGFRGVRTGCAERTKVPSRQDCSGGGGRQGSFTAQCSEEAFSCGRRTGKDDGEGVGQKVGRPGDLTSSGARRGIQSEQVGEALGDSRVMVCRVVLCQVRGWDRAAQDCWGSSQVACRSSM